MPRRIGRGSAAASTLRSRRWSGPPGCPPIRGFARYGSRGRAISRTSSAARRRPCGSFARRSNSGGFRRTRPRGRRSISRRSRGHGPAPPRSGASRASLKTWPTAATTGEPSKPSMRCRCVSYWDQLDDGTRQHVSAIVERLAVPADDPQRLAALGLIDPVHRGREVIARVGQAVAGRHGRSRPVDGRRSGRDGCVGRQPRASVPSLRGGGIPVRRPAGAAGPVPRVRGLGRASTAARFAWRSRVRQRRPGSPRKRASSDTCSPRSLPMPSLPPSGARRKRPIV